MSRSAQPISEAIASQLVGVWRLVSCVNQQQGREDNFPLGTDAEGFLIYTSDGYVSAQLMKTRRPLFQSGDWQHATEKEFEEAGSGYIGYCGAYEVDEEKRTVTHIPSVAFFPNLISKRQLRFLKLHGDRLTLQTAGSFVDDGEAITSRLEWRRVTK